MARYFVEFDPITTAVTSRYDDTLLAPPAGATNYIEVPDQATMLQTCQGGWTVVDGKLVPPAPPTSAQQLARAQRIQIGIVTGSYNNAIIQPVSYTSVGNITKLYQCDAPSISNLQSTILSCQAINPTSPATPSGFYWVSEDNTQVPFTYQDLQNLAALIFNQSLTAFQHLQTLKTNINNATSVASVQAIVW